MEDAESIPREQLEQGQSREEQEAPTKKSRAFKLAFVSLCACNFISILDTVIIAAALPAIADALDATSNQAYWCGTGFLFAETIVQPVYGALSEVFGRKVCLLVALSIFTLGSLLCAVAQDISWLIGARVVQGLGAGGNDALVTIIVADMVSLRERGKYIGLMALVSAVALLAGYVMGAAIASRSTWRLVFYINLPVCVPALLGILKFLNLQPSSVSLRENIKNADWTGMVILTGSLISILFGVTSGGVLYPWASANTLSALIIGVVGTTGFFLYEAFLTRSPMVPLRIFGNRTSLSAYFTSFVLGVTLWAMEYYLILYFLVTKRKSLLGAAVDILPGTSTVPPFAAIAGFVIAKAKRFRTINSVALVLLSVGLGLTSLLRPDSNRGIQYGFQVLYGIGGGALFPGRMVAVQASQLDEDVPMATAMSSFTISLGQAFGVAIGGAIFQNEWNHKVAAYHARGVIPSQYRLSNLQAEQTASLIANFPETVQNAYRRILSESINTIFIVLASFAAVATVASFTSKNISLDRDSKSSQAFIEKGKDPRSGSASSIAEKTITETGLSKEEIA
ncbi:drug resistance transporter [Xylogone sp. PMI_703]|nr:drug resistance transporter [Xylogone sp. PMI_703]